MDTIRILSLEIENFLSVKGRMVLDLSDRGLVLIDGPNGSGKSTIFADAICYCIYGEAMRDISKDDVVNRFIGRNCHIGLKLQHENNLIEIDTYRKHNKHKD